MAKLLMPDDSMEADPCATQGQPSPESNDSVALPHPIPLDATHSFDILTEGPPPRPQGPPTTWRWLNDKDKDLTIDLLRGRRTRLRLNAVSPSCERVGLFTKNQFWIFDTSHSGSERYQVQRKFFGNFKQRRKYVYTKACSRSTRAFLPEN